MEFDAKSESQSTANQSLQIFALITRFAMSYEERIEAHQNALQLSDDLKKAREAIHAISQKSIDQHKRCRSESVSN